MISKEIVKLFDGHISFTSQEGKGSCFWFTFKLENQIYQRDIYEESNDLRLLSSQIIGSQILSSIKSEE